LKRRWRVCSVAGCLVLGCSLLDPNITVQPRTPTLQPTASSTAVPERKLDGTWQAFYSWGCGSVSEASWILRADGTFYSPEADGGGIWNMKGSDFRLAFGYSPRATYTGKVNDTRDYMEGTMEADGGKTGCWHAERSRPTPSPTIEITRTPLPIPVI
jgi:hypothetical protein